MARGDKQGFLHRLARALSFSTALLGLATLIPVPVDLTVRLVRRRGFSRVLGMASFGGIMTLRALAFIFAPFVAVIGAIGSLLSWLRGDWLAVLAAEGGGALILRAIGRVAAGHEGFERAFGPGWQARISQSQWERMLPARWQPFLPTMPPARWLRDLRFGVHHETGRPLLCDLWQPPPGVEPTGLGAIYFHSSGWHALDKDFGTRRFFSHLSTQGHVVMDVSYTLAPEADMQGMLNDVRRAVAWMKTEGAACGVRPDRIVLMGGSAGAHLAMLAAYTPAHPDLRTPDVGDLDVSVRGVVSCYGVSDLAAFHYRQIALLGPPSEPRFSLPCLDAWLRERRIISTGSHGIRAQEMVSGAMRGLPEEMPEQYALYSPLAHAGAHCPPTLLLLGENDAGVLAREQGAPLAGKLRAAGAPVVYAVVPGANHGFDLYLTKWNPAFQSALYDIERFLALLL